MKPILKISATLLAAVSLSSIHLGPHSEKILSTPQSIQGSPVKTEDKGDAAALMAQKLECDWYKIAGYPKDWVNEEIKLEGWLSLSFAADGKIADVYLFDNEDSCQMRLSRRNVQLDTEAFITALEFNAKEPEILAALMHQACVEVRGTFKATSRTYHLGLIDGPMRLRLLPGQPATNQQLLRDYIR